MARILYTRGEAPDAVRPVLLGVAKVPRPTIDYFVATDEWVLREAYTYRDGTADILVPAGFTLDLASVPKPLRGFINSFELGIVGPLLHDFLYAHGGRTEERTYTRAEADRLFLQLMEEEGVPAWRRRLAFAAVRAFGGLWWKER